MSAKDKQTETAQVETVIQDAPVVETAKDEAKQPEKLVLHKPRVYCGPSVRGVARQYTVYAGEIPAALAEFIEAHPAAKGLLVSVERFAQVRSNLGKSGTAEAILYQKIKSEL